MGLDWDRPRVVIEQDADIVNRARVGDTEAFEVLYRRHVGRVYAVCFRIVTNQSRAEELTQQVFVRAWEMLHTFRGESAFSSWLYRIAVNIVLVDLRSERRRALRIELNDGLEHTASTPLQASPEEIMDLEEAIGALPPQARTIFVLHDVEGYQHDEIAEMMGLAPGTTKAQLHRARKLLKEKLER